MIVNGAIIIPAIEKILLRMGINKKAQPTVYPTAEDRTVNHTPIPGHPEIAIGLVQPPNVVVAHAVVLGQDDLNTIAAQFQLTTQAIDYIP
jgi:hypothetical protein